MARKKFDKNELTKQYTEKFRGINQGMMELRKSLNKQQYEEFNSKMEEVIRLRKKREVISIVVILMWFVLTIITMVVIPFIPVAAGAVAVTTIGAAGTETVGITALYGMVTKETDKSIVKVETEISNILAQQQYAMKMITDTLISENAKLQKALDTKLLGDEYNHNEETNKIKVKKKINKK